HAAFLKPVEGRTEGVLVDSIKAMTELREKFDRVYGACASGGHTLFDVEKGEGTLKELIAFSVAI
ncbi:MAG TPA: type I-E CRISPR-associated protein Cas7/Cse4/CasC, partial [Turneriella sp.]|nr:type I-E CRISPR-associated protein Cas7/Cse4/CasC [Turneriella sp.]